ncbi:heavy metal translocating P-type ATPase [Xanthobacter autotrophicus]|uniref:heavy metal translocating P-type ATPase n=1 Tax=Xanthobacter TaxID=279 RepID=UPI0024AC5E30|nr:heavy metal translocating P-type ATPase [Xanthobacter autotrophicus]MDI4666866.1 heavy metal translocating P-type ATPase [Xanthobacter autotrophicus]
MPGAVPTVMGVGLARNRYLLLTAAVLPLLTGLALLAAGQERGAFLAFVAGTVPVLAVLVLDIALALGEGRFGLDLLAALSMATALAFGEPLAGNVVALMYAGGQQLERFAEGRARREMTALVARAPRSALRREGESLSEVPINVLKRGDVVFVRHADTIPADGCIVGGAAVLDQSSLTGEAQPVRLDAGEEAPSGAVNVGGAFDIRVLRPAAESTYAAIVRLVEAAAASRAPMARLADRYALAFLVVSLALALGAAFLSGDPRRALAVLVVATPCPLILAVPVALMAGLSRAAKRGVLVKSGGALEKLAAVRALVIDKTGTLTHGRAELQEIRAAPGCDADEVLRVAAALDQASAHVVAAALVKAAKARGLVLAPPERAVEDDGIGISGRVEGRDVVVGGCGFVAARTQGDPAALRNGLSAMSAVVAVGLDGRLAGLLLLADRVRDDAAAMLGALRAGGVEHIALASGDRMEAVEALGRRLGLDSWAGDLQPEGKVAQVVEAHARLARGTVMMVGDGVNDAPALAAADVGVALGARGAAASAEVADVVLLVDRLDRLAEAMAIARRALAIARQSVFIGIGLSLMGMVAAAFGLLEPVAGALLQEAIDVAVILNALRVLIPGPGEG